MRALKKFREIQILKQQDSAGKLTGANVTSYFSTFIGIATIPNNSRNITDIYTDTSDKIENFFNNTLESVSSRK